MMSDYLKSITPDSFSGIIFALEGVSNTVVLINGPTGCKFYHSSVSSTKALRQSEFDPQKLLDNWFFGQPRTPSTHLDSRDYIYGSKDKLEEALTFIRDNVPFDLLCVVNSPGAALIGDDLKGIADSIIEDKPVILFETPGFSSDICSGFETAVIELIKKLSHTSGKKHPGFVNILGLSIFHRNFEGDIAELRRLFGLCGINVSCFPGALCSTEDIKDLPQAELNIVINPEYGIKTAEYLYAQFGTPYYVCDGPPIGFSATEKMVSDVCKILNKNLSAFIEESERARARAYTFINRVNTITGLPKGVNFAVEGTYSELYAYISFLVRYFGMIPECAAVLSSRSDVFKEKLISLLSSLGVSDALGRDILETKSELVFSSGSTISKLKLNGHSFSGIEISMPTIGYADVIPKTQLGIQGALLITEQIINGLMY